MISYVSRAFTYFGVFICILIFGLTFRHEYVKCDVVCPYPGSIPLTLQLGWVLQGEYGGYIIAWQRGFYQDECLIVSIRPGTVDSNLVPAHEVYHDRAQVAIVLFHEFLAGINEGNDLLWVSSIFQRPMIRLITLKKNNYNKFSDLINKRICYASNFLDAPKLYAYLNNMIMDEDGGLGKSVNASFNVIPCRFDAQQIQDLMDGYCDAITIVIYNELGQYLQHINPDTNPKRYFSLDDFNLLNIWEEPQYQPIQEKTAWVEDGIVVRKTWLDKPGNEALLIRFLRASYRGWLYQRDYPNESNKYFNNAALQLYQLTMTNTAIWPYNDGLGTINIKQVTNQFNYFKAAHIFNSTRNNVTINDIIRTDYVSEAHIGLIQDSNTDPTKSADIKGLDFQPNLITFCPNRGEDFNIPVPCSASIIYPYYNQPSHIQIIFIVLSSLSSLLCILLLIFLIYARHHSVIKSASNRFLIIILFGCILSFITVPLLTQYTPTNNICLIQVITGHLSFILIFGSLFLKTIRVKTIFQQQKIKLISISDNELSIKLLVLTLIIVIYIIIWSQVSQPIVQLVLYNNTTYYYECTSDQSYWPNLIIIAEVLFAGYGVYLSIQTRNIPSLFSDSKTIAVSLYNLFILGGITLLLTKLVISQTDTRILFQSIALYITTNIIVFVIFGPKLLYYYQNKDDTLSTNTNNTNLYNVPNNNTANESNTAAKIIGKSPPSNQEKINRNNTNHNNVTNNINDLTRTPNNQNNNISINEDKDKLIAQLQAKINELQRQLSRVNGNNNNYNNNNPATINAVVSRTRPTDDNNNTIVQIPGAINED